MLPSEPMRLPPFLLVLLLLLQLLAATPAQAQLLPNRGPSGEQQEIASVLLIAPEATVLGGVLGGGAVFLTVRQCCTPQHDSDQVALAPIAIGAGVGAAIGATWAVFAICDRFHPGNRTRSAIGGAIGAGIGAAVFFGGPQDPEAESPSDGIYRLLTFLFLPSIAAYGGWHLEGGGYYFSRNAPPPAWAMHVGPERERPPLPMPSLTIRF